MVDSLKLSLTDQQLPMFIRIMQLGIALYYGEIGNTKEEVEDSPSQVKDTVINMPGKLLTCAVAGENTQTEAITHCSQILCVV